MTTRAPQCPKFFLHMAYAFLAIALIGFSTTFFIPLAQGSFSAPPVIHIHGALLFGCPSHHSGLSACMPAGVRRLAACRSKALLTRGAGIGSGRGYGRESAVLFGASAALEQFLRPSVRLRVINQMTSAVFRRRIEVVWDTR